MSRQLPEFFEQVPFQRVLSREGGDALCAHPKGTVHAFYMRPASIPAQDDRAPEEGGLSPGDGAGVAVRSPLAEVDAAGRWARVNVNYDGRQ